VNRKQRRATAQRARGRGASAGIALAGPTPRNLAINEAFSLGVSHHQAGRLKNAEELYNKVLQLDPGHSDATHYLGVMAHQVGRYDVSVDLIGKAIARKPDDAAPHLSLGNVCTDMGLLDEAVASYQRAIAIKTDFPMAHSNLGNVLMKLGRLDDAVASYRLAISIKPDLAEAHSNLGNALMELGKLADAAVSCRRAISLNRDLGEAHFNLGNVLRQQGKLDQAVASFQRAIAINPGFADAHMNLGNILRQQGKLDQAIASCQRAAAIKPDLVGAHTNLGTALEEQGEFQQALKHHFQALGLEETAANKLNFARCLKALRFTQINQDLKTILTQAMREAWVSPNELWEAAASMLKSDPAFRDLLGIARADSSEAARLFQNESFARLAVDPLFLTLLESTLVADPEIELFLTFVRRAMLAYATQDAVAEPEENSDRFAFFCALADQSFTNEYAHAETAEETDCVEQLCVEVAGRIRNGAPVRPLHIVAIACYRPLHAVETAENLLRGGWPDSLEALITRQIREPMAEVALRAEIPELTAIDDKVSMAVQAQYEENPYPRWVKVPIALEARPLEVVFREHFPEIDVDADDRAEHTDILVAGCGTGQHPINTARRFKNARVLAVDLSLTSLGYAMRKTRELGLGNIDYARADILELGTIQRRFDVIESVGVLHHLADPMVGWRILTSLLRPGGFMRVGLYSHFARQWVVAAREFIAQADYTASSADIRRCRQAIHALDDGEDIKKAVRQLDFYSVSTCRDLLFHVQEHRFTLLEIDSALQELGLEFLGFETHPVAHRRFRAMFPKEANVPSLNLWHLLESENPDVFMGMYQFWVRRKKTA